MTLRALSNNNQLYKVINCITKAIYYRVFSGKPTRESLYSYWFHNFQRILFTQNFENYKNNSCYRSVTFKPGVTTDYRPIHPK